MLRCHDVTERTSDYIDRALSTRERLAMRLHFMLCAACRAYLAQMRATIALLRGRPLGAPPAGLEERIGQQAERLAHGKQDESPG